MTREQIVSLVSLIEPQRTFGVLHEIAAERARQDRRWGLQDHSDGTGGVMREVRLIGARARTEQAEKTGALTWVDIADEEDSEAAVETDEEKLRAECIQAAAVYTAWIEAIDRRRARRAKGFAK